MRDLQTITIPGGAGGINRSKALTRMPTSDLTYADTVTVERDLIEKEPGAALVNTTPLSGGAGTWAVKAHWQFISGAGVQEDITAIDNGISVSIVVVPASGAVVKTLISGLTTGSYITFSEGWNGTTKTLYIFSNLDNPMSYTGGATATVLTGGGGPGQLPLDWTVANWPTTPVSHRARMIGFGNANFPHNIYGTVPGSENDYNGGESFVQPVYPGSGERLVAGASWREILYLWKFPRGIFVLNDTDPSIANWSVPKITEAIGVASPESAVVIEDDIVMLATDGFLYSLSQIQTQGQVSVPPFLPMETAQFIKEKLNLSRLDLVRGRWYGSKRQLHFAVPSGTSTVCDARIILDLHMPGAPKFFWSSRDTCPALGMRRATTTAILKPCFGDSSGNLYDMDQATRSKNGAGYNGQYECPPVAPSGVGQFSNLHELQLTMDPQGNWDLTMEVHRDGVLSQTLAYSMNTPGGAVGSMSLDADVMAGKTVSTVKHELTGEAIFTKLIGYNSGAGQNFAVMDTAIRYTPGRAA
jgi:hypothetical protein